MTSGRIKVRLYATAEIRVPLVTEIDLDEYRDWVEEGGNGYCPVHHGFAQGVDATLAAVRQKLGELE